MVAFGEIAAHSAYDVFSKYKCLILSLFFPPRFWSGDFFLIAPFPDHCLLVPFYLIAISFISQSELTYDGMLGHIFMLSFLVCLPLIYVGKSFVTSRIALSIPSGV